MWAVHDATHLQHVLEWQLKITTEEGIHTIEEWTMRLV